MPNPEEDVTSVSPVSLETIQMIAANLAAPSNVPVTEEHIEEMLSQRRQINEFINEDKKRNSFDKKYYLTGGLIFILIISALILFTHPEYFTQVLSLIIGGFGGFGFGKLSSDND